MHRNNHQTEVDQHTKKRAAIPPIRDVKSIRENMGGRDHFQEWGSRRSGTAPAAGEIGQNFKGLLLLDYKHGGKKNPSKYSGNEQRENHATISTHLLASRVWCKEHHYLLTTALKWQSRSYRLICVPILCTQFMLKP